MRFRGKLLTIVGGTLAELHGAEEVGQGGHLSGHTTQGPQLLLGRLALIVRVQDVGVLESCDLVDGLGGLRRAGRFLVNS